MAWCRTIPRNLSRSPSLPFLFPSSLATTNILTSTTTPSITTPSSSNFFFFRPYSASTHPASTITMAPIPATMNAIRASRLGGPDVLEHVTDEPVPALRDGEILVRDEFAGINFIDIYFREGLYKTPLPYITGREAVGTVAAVHASVAASSSSEGRIKVGDRVAYMHPGACASYHAVPAAKAVVVPDSVPSDVGAAAFLQGLTAHTFVREAGQVREGQWTLVHAAAGGVGLLLVQMLRNVGAKVIAVASTEEKCALAREHGAGWTVSSGDADLVGKVKEMTGGHGVDVIFDGVGKATFDADLEMVARKGTIVSFGNASGVVPPLDILRLGPKNVRVLRPVVNNYLVEREELEEHASDLFQMIASGSLKINIHKTYALKDIAQAHIDLASRKTTGKLIVKID